MISADAAKQAITFDGQEVSAQRLASPQDLRPMIGARAARRRATIAIASHVAVSDKGRRRQKGNGAAKTRNLRLLGSDKL